MFSISNIRMNWWNKWRRRNAASAFVSQRIVSHLCYVMYVELKLKCHQNIFDSLHSSIGTMPFNITAASNRVRRFHGVQYVFYNDCFGVARIPVGPGILKIPALSYGLVSKCRRCQLKDTVPLLHDGWTDLSSMWLQIIFIFFIEQNIAVQSGKLGISDGGAETMVIGPATGLLNIPKGEHLIQILFWMGKIKCEINQTCPLAAIDQLKMPINSF